MVVKQTWIQRAEEKYQAKYVGRYDLPDREGPFYVFYQENPDRSKGHDEYFGLFWRTDTEGDEPYLMITSAKTIRNAKFSALRINNRWLVSRSVHDYVTEGAAMLDGGLDYTRYNPEYPPTHDMTIENGEEVFHEL